VAGRSDRAVSSRRARKSRSPATPDVPAELTRAELPEADLDDDVVHAGLDIRELDLSGREAAGAELDQCRYSSVSFGEVRLRRATLKDVVFDKCDLANLRARECSIRRASFAASRMTGLTWITGTMQDVTFDGCRIDLGYFSATKISDVVFTGCRLDQANFGDAELSNVRFENCDLSGVQFSGARLADTRFSGCVLNGISGVTSLRGASMTSADALALAVTLAQALGISIDDD
jgi:uncharacterized protein YjbI with pentapeptide repeats